MQVQDWKEMVAAGSMALMSNSWTSLILISILVCILTTLLCILASTNYVRNLVASRYPANDDPKLTVDLLSLCAENVNVIENLVNDGNLLNKRQCLDLSVKLSKTIRNIQELVSHCGATVVLSRLALETLYRTLKKARLLVRDCHNEDWCRASINQMENANAFREILLDVGFCYHAIREQVKGCSMQPEDLCQSFLFQPASDSDIDGDQQELRKRLEEIVSTSRWSSLYLGPLLTRVAQKHCLAQYLLSKSKCLSREFQSRDLVTSGRLLLVKDTELTEGSKGSCNILGPSQDGTVVIRTEWFGVPAAMKVFCGGGYESFFLKEAAILAHLNHPRIVNFYCCGNDHSNGVKHFITMELLETSLYELIKKQAKPFSLPVAVDIIVQIARGMCYLHDVGVAHRDLKPQNVVANRLSCQYPGDEYYCVKLVDFGLSKTKVEASKYNSISARGVGTTRYRAPEVHPKAHPDSKGKAIWFKADVYSFAMTCYHILSLQVPFGNLGEFLMYEEQVVLGRRPELPKDCPKVLVSLLRECWDSVPGSRPYFLEICTRLEKFRHDLLRGLGGFDQSLQEPDMNHFANYHIIEEKLKQYSSIQSRSVGESDAIIIECASGQQTQTIPDYRFKDPVTHAPGISANELSLHEATSAIIPACTGHDMLPSFERKYTCLEDVIPKGLPNPEAVDVVLQIAEAMLHMHKSGIAHRDLKPGNILISSSTVPAFASYYSVKLVDFGTSKMKRKGSNSNDFTLCDNYSMRWVCNYTAPEIISSLASRKSERETDWFKADVWSFGILCYEILSTRHQTCGDLDASVFHLVTNCLDLEPLSRPSFSSIVEALLIAKSSVFVRSRGLHELNLGLGPYHVLDEVNLDPVNYEFTRKVDAELLVRYGFKEPVTRMVSNEQGRLLDELMRFRPSDMEPKHQILLSHCDADSSFVELLRKDLEARNVGSLVACSSTGNVSNFTGATRPCCVEIFVISKDYLSLECSILKLAKYATECRPEHHILYPVFYKLSAHDLIAESNLDHIMGRWSELAKTIPDVNLDQLTTAIDQLTSFALSANDSSYSDSANSEFGFRKGIVTDICKLLPQYLPYDTSNIVGHDRLCKELSGSFLEHSKTGAQVLGLYGAAGVGKTALSKVLCNYFQKNVPRIRVCRLEFKVKDGVVGKRRAETSHGQLEMLKMVLRTLLGCDEAVLNKISSVSWGLKLLQSQKTQHPVFLVLDNVSYETQVEASAYLKFASFHAKSKVLVIARSQDALKKFLQDSRHCKPMPELTEEEAADLLLKYGNSSKKHTGLTYDEKMIVKKCLKKCYIYSNKEDRRRYHPSVIVAMGEYFNAQDTASDSNIMAWKEHLHFLLMSAHVTSKSLLDALVQWFKGRRSEQPTSSRT